MSAARRIRTAFVVGGTAAALMGGAADAATSATNAATNPATNPASSATNSAAPATDADVARGEYLQKAAHCSACHTSDDAKPFAGGLPIVSKFGTMYTSNITPDPATGLGRWTEKDFEGSLRRGIGKDHEYLYPAMPYTNFTKISDADIHALWAYFRSIKPIHSAPPANKMTFPFNVRPGIAAWQAVYLHEGRYVDDPSQSQEWNRGAYLVQGLGHCGACHTPTNVAMAQVSGKPLEGNVVDHWFAPNISGDRYSNLNKWNEDELATYLKTGHNDKNLAAVGPMQQTIDLGTSQLSDQDLHAIATYLKHQVAGTQSAPASKRVVTAQERDGGHAVYTANCVTCHGTDGRGVAGIAPSLVGAGSTTGAQSDTAIRAVLQGFAPSGQWGVMPAFAQVLTAQQVSDVVNYVRTSWGNTGAGEVTVSSVTHLAMYSDLADNQVESALICPSPSATEIDPTTVAQIKALADTPQPQQATAKLVGDYRTRHPKVDRTTIVTTIAGTYCRDVMAASKGTLAERQTRYVNFMGGVAQAAAAH